MRGEVTREGDTTPREPRESDAGRTASTMLRWIWPMDALAPTPLAGETIELGRDAACAVQLSGDLASRRHAQIHRSGDDWVIRDLDSTNGVRINGKRMARAPLRLGDVVRVGNCIAVVSSYEDADPAPSQLARELYGGRAFRALLEPAKHAAATDLPIVIEGATGTGKERTAQAIHEWSGRGGPFVAVNCAAVPESLAEAELFGYRKGAFTGADRASPGHFRAAEGGTLLLDEILDIPAALQAKLLRVLEQREVLPLGQSTPVPIDVRVLVATQEPLRRAVEAKRFRGDLYARLDGLTLRLPALRERIEDVPLLFTRLLERHAGAAAPPVDVRLVERLLIYDWPFNIRELELLARRLLILHGREPVLRAKHLPDRFSASGDGAAASEHPAGPSDDDAALEALRAALREHAGNVSRAAAAAGISRPRAYRLMRGEGDLSPNDFRPRRRRRS